MKLTNDSYIISMGTKNFTEKYFRDEDGWVKISAKGRKFRMTAEQILNHLLPAISNIKPGLTWKVEHKNQKNLVINNFTKDELEEALRSIVSTIGKCEKVQPKLKQGTSQHTLLTRRIKALDIASALIEKELGHPQ
jgi:hypothetical protein